MSNIYFDLLPYELFGEIIKYIYDMKTYLLFISTINYRITPDNLTTFKSNTLRIFTRATHVNTHIDKLRNVYFLPTNKDRVEIHDYDKQILFNSFIGVNRMWELLCYQQIYTDNLLFQLS